MYKEQLIRPDNIELMFIWMDAFYQNALKEKMNLPSNMEKMFNESSHALYKQVHEKAVNKIFSEKGIFYNGQWPGSVLPTLKDFGVLNLKNKQDGGNKRRRSKKSNRLLKKSRKRSKKIQRGAGGEWIAAMVLFPFIILFHIVIHICWSLIPLQRDSYTADVYSTTYDHDEPVVGHEPG